MNSFFPDVNVWLALVDVRHSHYQPAWNWLNAVSLDDRLILARFCQLGILRLLTNSAVMSGAVMNIGQAWNAVARLMGDSRVEFRPEPNDLDPHFRRAMAPLAEKPASKWIGDCYVIASANAHRATLVTFDRALLSFAETHGYAALRPN